MFKLFYLSVSVQKLPIHLQDQQYVYWAENTDPQKEFVNDDEEDDPKGRSKLSEFFKLCSENPDETNDLKYIDVYNDYRCDKTLGWISRIRRVAKKTVGRMPILLPKAREVFYL